MALQPHSSRLTLYHMTHLQRTFPSEINKSSPDPCEVSMVCSSAGYKEEIGNEEVTGCARGY